MLTVDIQRLGIEPGQRVLDMGCGGGRHAYELYRRGARVTALDMNAAELVDVAEMLTAMEETGEAPRGARAHAVRATAYALPFADATFDRVVAAEVLEHLPQDDHAMRELFRVLKPGGVAAVTVPRWGPELLCWALSSDYHEVEGGHVRIYRGDELRRRLRTAGFVELGAHHAHALHAPYWWLRCAVGMDRAERHPVVRTYQRLLEWDIVQGPRVTRVAERLLNPVLGKSLVVYLRRPAAAAAAAAA